jgi:hypothetical protein
MVYSVEAEADDQTLAVVGKVEPDHQAKIAHPETVVRDLSVWLSRWL